MFKLIVVILSFILSFMWIAFLCSSVIGAIIVFIAFGPQGFLLPLEIGNEILNN